MSSVYGLDCIFLDILEYSELSSSTLVTVFMTNLCILLNRIFISLFFSFVLEDLRCGTFTDTVTATAD